MKTLNIYRLVTTGSRIIKKISCRSGLCVKLSCTVLSPECSANFREDLRGQNKILSSSWRNKLFVKIYSFNLFLQSFFLRLCCYLLAYLPACLAGWYQEELLRSIRQWISCLVPSTDRKEEAARKDWSPSRRRHRIFMKGLASCTCVRYLHRPRGRRLGLSRRSIGLDYISLTSIYQLG